MTPPWEPGARVARTPVPMAVAFAMLGMTAEERVLVAGSLADALAYAAGASSPVAAEPVDDERPTVVPPRGPEDGLA